MFVKAHYQNGRRCSAPINWPIKTSKSGTCRFNTIAGSNEAELPLTGKNKSLPT
ncbi:hypothetical protein [Bacillus subtilis]|uniref:hypothetical protein n=1 Tax=Bacillus subtilis TaxID=1423 RepID=UPI003A5D044D